MEDARRVEQYYKREGKGKYILRQMAEKIIEELERFDLEKCEPRAEFAVAA